MELTKEQIDSIIKVDPVMAKAGEEARMAMINIENATPSACRLMPPISALAVWIILQAKNDQIDQKGWR